MRKPLNKRDFVSVSLHILGLLLCTLPPAVCTVLYFPMWQTAGGGRAFSGVCAFFVIISALPLYKALKALFRSPASYLVWTLIFLFCFLFSRIAEEATVRSFVGAVSNILGAVLFRIAKRREASVGE